MSNLLIYIISTGVCLSLFVLAYQIFLKDNNRFNLCRFFLISSILLSFLIPSMPIDLGLKPVVIVKPTEIVEQPRFEYIGQSVSNVSLVEAPTIKESSCNVDPVRIIGIIIASISALFFVRLLYRFGSIILIRTSGKRLDADKGLNLILTDKTNNAFSFLGYIFINPLKFNDEEKRLIIDHEREHIRHFHSIDLILIELLIVLQWFNPFAYITRRKLIEIHEFIADNGVIRKGADPYSYQNLLLSVVTSSCLPSAGNQLSAFITKKRIAMIGKPLKQTGRWINFLVLVPIATLLIIGTSAFNPRPIERNINNEKTHSINLTDSTTFKFLEKRAQNEIKDTWLKDFTIDLAPNSSQSYSIILKKGEIYNIHLFSESKDEKLGMKIVYNKSETEKETVADNIFKYSQLSFLPIKTGSFTIITINPTAINKKALIVITLKETKEKVENISNNQNLQDTTKDNDQPLIVVEQMPTFGNGNEDEFPKWISTNMQYPKEAVEKGVHGKVIVEFFVSKDGSIKNPKIVRSVNPLLDAEALRLINTCPKWNPGKQRGMAMDVKVTQPINFSAFEIKKNAQTFDLQNIDEQTFNEFKYRANKEVKGIQLADFYINVEPRRFNMYTITLKQGCEYTFNLFTKSNDDKYNAIISRGKPAGKLVKVKEIIVSNSSKFNYTPTETGYYVLTLENISSTKTPALMVLSYTGGKNSIAEWGKSDFPGIYEGLEKADITYYQEKKEIQLVGDDVVFKVVEEMPVFRNGIEGEFESWVTSNIQFPKEVAEKGVQGRVFVEFVIEKDGSVSNAKIIRGVDPAIDKEAIRVVLSSPKWNPGMQRGVPVRVQYTFPITFSLDK